jgi:HEAT repeat protein
MDAIVEAAGESRRVLGDLVALTYDASPLIAWRAVEAMGRAAARIADEDADGVREQLRRLHWLLHEESGGICWRAPEAMAEIVRQRPSLFADYVPIVTHLLLELAEEDLAHFRPGVLWAIGRLGALAGEQIGDVLPKMVAALDDPAPQVRGMAVWALARVGAEAALVARPDLLDDAGPVEVYEDGDLARTTVGHLAQGLR